MKSIAELEEQIKALNTLNSTSAKALDTLADTSNSISVRAQNIIRDVKPWEVAQENIALTIEEMSKAARCYHPPPALHPVLSGKETNPEAVSRCIDYLVYTDDYLTSHPPNDYGNEIQAKTERHLRQVVELSEDLVKKSFMLALQRPTQAPPGGVKGLVIKNSNALNGVGAIISRLGENFNRTDVVVHDVCNLLQTRAKALVEARFDGTYREEEAGRSASSRNVNMAPVMKHYQYGDHPLLCISSFARDVVTEVSRCIDENILRPLDNDYVVAEMPSELGRIIFDVITARAYKVINVDFTTFHDATQMFIDSRGQGMGLLPGKRYFQDTVLCGLNLVEELWAWKTLSNDMPGEKDNFIDYVDNEAENYLSSVRELLDGYVSSKGTMGKDSLKEATTTQRRSEWIPSANCTAHESTTNLLYFHKMLLGPYYGALKVTLYGNTLILNAEVESVRAVENFLNSTVLGTIRDMETVIEAAIELHAEAREKKRYHLRGDLQRGGEYARLSKEIFMLNNIIFLEDNYRREKCFQQRVFPVSVPDGDAAGHRRIAAEQTAIPIVTRVLEILQWKRESIIRNFGVTWECCFPAFQKDADLASISQNAQEPLRKSQRTAVKHWNRSVAAVLSDRIRGYKECTVMSTSARTRLIELSVQVVRVKFHAFDAIIQGRVWSRHPQKWMPFSVDEWIDQVKKIF